MLRLPQAMFLLWGSLLIRGLAAFKPNSSAAAGRQGLISGTFPWAHAPHRNFVPAGVITYAIGVAWAAQDELDVIATHPAKDHAFFVDEFDSLYQLAPKVIQNICTEFNSRPRN